MKLVTVDDGGLGRAAALLSSGDIVHFSRAAASGTLECWMPVDMRGLLGAGESGLSVVRHLIARIEAMSLNEQEALRHRGAIIEASRARLLAPIPEPRLIIGGNRNYRSHLKEMSGAPEPDRPTGFLKVAASVVGPSATIRLPPQAPTMVDWEGELGCVIGRECHNVGPEEAASSIAGYTIINDVSARDWVGEVFRATDPWDARLTWELNIMGKQFPGFTAMGPVIVTVDEIGPYPSLTLQTRLNGQVVQHDRTDDVIFGFAESIAYFSKWYEFHPGDIVTTGTPAGVGAGRKPARYMGHGDTIEVEISGIGVLENRLEAALPLQGGQMVANIRRS